MKRVSQLEEETGGNRGVGDTLAVHVDIVADENVAAPGTEE